MEKKLSRTEKRIISRLDENARSRFKEIGKSMRMSEQNVSYTVNSLISRGVIRNFYTLVDYSRLSVLNFRVFFKINYINQKMFDDMVNTILKDGHSMWVTSCGGRYDLLCTFGARNPSEFNKNLKRILAEFPRQIRSYDILTTTVIRLQPRKYLDDRTRHFSDIIIGGDREPYDLSDKDIQIIYEISENARKSSVEIGKKVECSPRTVLNRLSALKKIEVIRGFRPLIEFSETEYITKLLLVKYHNISVDEENKLIEHLQHHPNISCIVKTIGRWDVEIRIEAKDYRDFMRIEREIREIFSDMIQQTETIPLYSEYKNTFFPRFLLNK